MVDYFHTAVGMTFVRIVYDTETLDVCQVVAGERVLSDAEIMDLEGLRGASEAEALAWLDRRVREHARR